MNVHEKIKLMRETKEWSQEEMAEKLNMSVSGYSKIERGETNPHISKLEQIAQILGIDLIELISFGEKHVYLITDIAITVATSSAHQPKSPLKFKNCKCNFATKMKLSSNCEMKTGC